MSILTRLAQAHRILTEAGVPDDAIVSVYADFDLVSLRFHQRTHSSMAHMIKVCEQMECDPHLFELDLVTGTARAVLYLDNRRSIKLDGPVNNQAARYWPEEYRRARRHALAEAAAAAKPIPF